MKIEDKSIQLINNSLDKKTNIEKEKSFKRVLAYAINNNEEINNSKTIANMEKLLNVDIRNNKDKYVKDNGKIKIIEIIDQYGGKIGSNDLHEFLKIVNSLYKEELIDIKDYFEALKWIELKIKQKSTEVQIESKKKDEILNLI